MLRNHLNYFLAVLYRRNRATMKWSTDSNVVLIAKLQLGMLLFLYVLPLVGALVRFWTHQETDVNFTGNRTLDAVLTVGVFLVPVHLVAWPADRVVAFALDEEHQGLLQQAQRTMLVLVVMGFCCLVVSAKYNVGTL